MTTARAIIDATHSEFLQKSYFGESGDLLGVRYDIEVCGDEATLTARLGISTPTLFVTTEPAHVNRVPDSTAIILLSDAPEANQISATSPNVRKVYRLDAFSLDALFRALLAEIERPVSLAETATPRSQSFITLVQRQAAEIVSRIDAQCELLLSSSLTADSSPAIRQIKEECARLSRLSGTALDLFSSNLQSTPATQDDENINSFLSQTLASFVDRCRTKSQEIYPVISPDLNRTCRGPFIILKRLIMELIDNSIAFTPPGGVIIFVADPTLSAEGHMWLHCRVADSGAGIPAHLLSVLSTPGKTHQPLYLLDGPAAGAGLGLALAVSLVQSIGGTINVESKPMVGSRFSFMIPFETLNDSAPAASSPEITAATPLPRSRILVVEDHLINQKVMTSFLNRMGHEVTIVKDGFEATEVCRLQKFDLIFMDIHMPRMDGIHATKVIRCEEASRGGFTPIIAWTTVTIESDKSLFRSVGMNGYLGKPFMKDELERILQKYLTAGAHS